MHYTLKVCSLSYNRLKFLNHKLMKDWKNEEPLTSLDWKSLVIAKKASVASVVPKCSPWTSKDTRVETESRCQGTLNKHKLRSTLHFHQTSFYLVEEVDNLGEDVEASSWVDRGLIEDTCLWTREEPLLNFGLFRVLFLWLMLICLIDVQNMFECTCQ